MLNKNKYFFVSLLVFVFGFLLNSGNIQAADPTNCNDGCKSLGYTGSDLVKCVASCDVALKGGSNCNDGCKSLGYSGLDLTKCVDSCNTALNSIKSSTADAANTSGATTTEFINPIGWKSVSELVDAVLNNLMGIIAFIAVIFIIIGGIMYMTSGGSETMITRAKKTIAGAVIGLAIAIASPTFLKEIQSILGGSNASGTAAGWVSGALTIKQIAINVLNLLLSIIGIVGIIALVIAGGMYLTAYGSEKKLDSAKKIATYAVIGIIVALASLVIIRQVDNLLRGGSASSANFEVAILQMKK